MRREWSELKRFYTSPGFAEEEVIVFVATDLHDAERESDEEERMEIVAWPLAELDGAIEECRDAKSLIGLLLFRELRRRLTSRESGCTGRGGPPEAKGATWRSRSSTATSSGGRRGALRGAGARFPRLSGVRAGLVPQHARRLPHRPAPVRDLPRQAATGARPRPSAATWPTSSPTSRPVQRPARVLARRRSTARPRACAPSTATCAARS